MVTVWITTTVVFVEDTFFCKHSSQKISDYKKTYNNDLKRELQKLLYLVIIYIYVKLLRARGFRSKKISFIILNIPRGTDDLPDAPGFRIYIIIIILLSKLRDGSPFPPWVEFDLRARTHTVVVVIPTKNGNILFAYVLMIILCYRSTFFFFFHFILYFH